MPEMLLDQVLPNVVVGSFPRDSADIARLKADYGVTAVLSLQSDEDLAYLGINWANIQGACLGKDIQCRRVPVLDFNPDDLRRRLPRCVEALDELLCEGHTVYVHCSGGINRAPSTVVAYLHWVQGMKLDDALALVTERHPCEPYVDAILLATQDRENQRGQSPRG
jgi:protein-tyrosine phosphatase